MGQKDTSNVKSKMNVDQQNLWSPAAIISTPPEPERRLRCSTVGLNKTHTCVQAIFTITVEYIHNTWVH